MRSAKEHYLNNNDLIQQFRLDFSNKSVECIKPTLLILDMQNYFLEKSSPAFVPDSRTILPGLIRLANKFRKKNLPVICTRHTNTPENAGMMAQWWKRIIQPGSQLSVLSKDVKKVSDHVIEKNQYDAFLGTNLQEILFRYGNTVVICGVMTHLCCETTARSAFCRGFKVFFPFDGNATYNKDFHRSSLLNLSHGFAYISSLEDVESIC